MDTKWKVLSEPTPSDAGLKQMYAYHHYLGARRTYLLYPDVYGLGSRTGTYHVPEDGGFTCALRFVEVLGADGRLNFGVGNDILKLLG